MEILELEKFNKLAEACGNKYVAVQWLSNQSRKLFKKNRRYKILESKIIGWALTGDCPYSDFELAKRKLINKLDHVDDILEFVTDIEVKQCVRTFYKVSVRNKQLTLCDCTDLSEYRLERVNILLRMSWYYF